MNGLILQDWMLRQRLAALDSELAYWKEQTRTNRRFKRHHTQVEAFSQIILDLRDSIDPKRAAVQDASDAKERARVVLALFRIWQFLRAKLVQRNDDSFHTFLWLADEYAWLCYKPLYDAGLKQPPLLFLNGGYSPFTLTRSEGFEAESVPHELLRSQSLQDAMASLPFPVIGVPWFQVRNLADLPVIGHEVGHSVEADLRLQTPILDAIDSAVTDNKDQWAGWASEIFADIYGCLGCGAAFVDALARFLSSESADAGGDKYPPPALRLQLNVEVLRALGDESGAASIEQEWGTSPALPSQRDELRKVADTVLDGVQVQGKPVRSLIPFDHSSVNDLVTRMVHADPIPQGTPMRVLVAAYSLVYGKFVSENTRDGVGAKLSRLDRLQNAMEALLTPDTRSGEIQRPQSGPTRDRLSQRWKGELNA
jgi:hypothetical protein